MLKHTAARPLPQAGPEAPSGALAGCFQKVPSLLYQATPLEGKSLGAWGVPLL